MIILVQHLVFFCLLVINSLHAHSHPLSFPLNVGVVRKIEARPFACLSTSPFHGRCLDNTNRACDVINFTAIVNEVHLLAVSSREGGVRAAIDRDCVRRFDY